MGEVSGRGAAGRNRLTVTTDPAQLAAADIIVVAVPTPVDTVRRPTLGAVGASTTVGKHMKNGAIVVYESTVYPGATEEVCIPVLERNSGMKWLTDFNVGYSPERINPGDKEHRLETIVKVVAGDTPETLERVAKALWHRRGRRSVPGLEHQGRRSGQGHREHPARPDIALVNELAIIFDRIGIDTLEVLQQAAGTKWNFLPFRPGLVGGHCIGVDPYYLTYKAEMLATIQR